MRGVAGVLLCGVLVAGCASSPPMRYYTLSERVPTDASPGAVGLKVGRISLPGEIDRTQLVYRVDANRLRITEMDRWAAPLDEMIRRVLTDNLTARLPDGAGTDPPSVLTLDILEFFGDADCAVTLRASWTLTGPQPRSSPGVDTVRVPPAGACPESLPVGMSTALGELTDRIVAGLQARSR